MCNLFPELLAGMEMRRYQLAEMLLLHLPFYPAMVGRLGLLVALAAVLERYLVLFLVDGQVP
jgi:hypothetical protein